VDELLAILPASGVVGERKFVHANHLYSVAALTDNSGAVVERYRYDAYGQRIVLAGDGVTLRWGSSHGNQVGFTGRYFDKETGLWYFRARYYSGSLGRFVSRDPLTYINGYSLYAGYFAPNRLDPSGMEEKTVTNTLNIGAMNFTVSAIVYADVVDPGSECDIRNENLHPLTNQTGGGAHVGGQVGFGVNVEAGFGGTVTLEGSMNVEGPRSVDDILGLCVDDCCVGKTNPSPTTTEECIKAGCCKRPKRKRMDITVYVTITTVMSASVGGGIGVGDFVLQLEGSAESQRSRRYELGKTFFETKSDCKLCD